MLVLKYTGTVKISGAVNYPNSVAYDKKNVKSYIAQAGWYKQSARRRPFVIYMNGQGGFDPHGFLLQALSEGGAGLRDRRAAEDGAQRQGEPAERDGHDDLSRFARRDGRLGHQPGEIIPGGGWMLLSHRDARLTQGILVFQRFFVLLYRIFRFADKSFQT